MQVFGFCLVAEGLYAFVATPDFIGIDRALDGGQSAAVIYNTIALCGQDPAVEHFYNGTRIALHSCKLIMHSILPEICESYCPPVSGAFYPVRPPNLPMGVGEQIREGVWCGVMFKIAFM